MLSLPRTTELNRRIPKNKFYEKLPVSPETKRLFIDQIKNVIWRNKIASTTANIAPGEKVTEIEFFEIQLNNKMLDEKVLKIIDEGIPYHIVFVLHYEEQIQIWTSYKEPKKKNDNQSKVTAYYHTDWMQEDEYSVALKGMNLDQAYEDLFREIAEKNLHGSREETLQESVLRSGEIDSLKRKIEKQQAKVRKEKQFNKKVQLNDELKKMKAELMRLENGKTTYGVS